MNEVITVQNQLEAVSSPVSHGLGPVVNDWEAAQVWLRAIASRGRRNSPETVATYGYHLAKLRWFCEKVHLVTPSRWTVQDVEAFFEFLKDLPESAVCVQDPTSLRFAKYGEDGHTPFRTQPSKSSRSDIQRCVFRAKLDTHSTANWTRIPRQTGHPVQRKLDTDSAPNWTV